MNPHNDKDRETASIASCTFLSTRPGDKRPELQPSSGGRVPRVLFLALFVDVTAVGLVVPMLASYSRALGAGPGFTGVLQATYGLCQLIGSNLFGGMSDTKGRKKVLRISALGAILGYALLYVAIEEHSLPLLLLSRIPVGLMKQSMTVSRALIADCTLPTTRMRPMSVLGAMVAAGFVFGPAFGGVLSKKISLTGLPPTPHPPLSPTYSPTVRFGAILHIHIDACASPRVLPARLQCRPPTRRAQRPRVSQSVYSFLLCCSSGSSLRLPLSHSPIPSWRDCYAHPSTGGTSGVVEPWHMQRGGFAMPLPSRWMTRLPFRGRRSRSGDLTTFLFLQLTLSS